MKKSLFAAFALVVAALATGCSSAPAKETPAPTAGCTSDDQCASAGPCGKCVSGSCQNVFGAECCNKDDDCGNPALRCRANRCK
jgi:hypothetical protein